jgi:HSP20 family molecular chaperone IbpA
MRNGSSCCTPKREGAGVSFLGRDMDQWLSQVLPALESNVGRCSYSALANVSETDANYEISLDLPGMSADDVQLEFKEGVLTISGERTDETTSTDRRFHRVERRSGAFSRSFEMHEIDGDKIVAEFKNGVLTIVAPKTPAATARKIDIKVS